MKREFVINRHGKDYVLYAGLLDEAHQQGLRSIKTQLVQAPTPQNGQVAICLAEVATEKGEFTGLGDASPENVSRAMLNALIRLAETRAKARALRDAINVSMVAVEELAESAPESISIDGPGGVSSAFGPLPFPGSSSAAATGGYEAAPRPAAVSGSSGTTAGMTAASGTSTTAAAAGSGVTSSAAQPVALPAGHTLPPGVVPLVPRQGQRAAAPLGSRPAPQEQGPLNGDAGRANGTSSATGAADAARTRRIRETTGSSANGKATVDGAPATPTQIETIAKLARSVGRIVPAQELTRAAASELITRLSEERYGARRGV
jgi:hypothetical protein